MELTNRGQDPAAELFIGTVPERVDGALAGATPQTFWPVRKRWERSCFSSVSHVTPSQFPADELRSRGVGGEMRRR
jgi:hypothetical protein